MRKNIKIHEKDKHIFDTLQAEFTLKTGKKINTAGSPDYRYQRRIKRK